MNKKYQGTVKTFNEKYGFIISELGETYFHKSGIIGKISIDKGDEVEFETEPSLIKVGSLQGCRITLIKKFEKTSIQLVNPILGILRWFDEKKGFGIITTPKDIDYILLKSNFSSLDKSPKTGDAFVFEKKTEKGKILASNCKAVSNYEDLKIALEYLFKNDNVNIEVKVKERDYGGRIQYSRQNRKISILKQTVFQIFEKNTIDIILNFISDYFRDKLTNKPSEEQLKYFNFIKTIFENKLNNDKIIILNSFFSYHIDFLRNHKEFCYSLWLEGYIQEKDLSYIAKQINKNSIDSYHNTFKKIFDKLIDLEEQSKVVNEFLEIFGRVDNEEKYRRIKSLANLTELNKNVKETFLTSVYIQSDSERKYLMWLDGYTREKDISYIAKQINKKFIDSNHNHFKKIFKKITIYDDQYKLLNEFLEIIGKIDTEEKYSRIKSLACLVEVDEKIKEKFLISAYNQSDEEMKYLMWLEGYTQVKDLSYIAKQIRKAPINSYHNPFEKIFKKLTDQTEQNEVLIEFLKTIDKIDNEEKYSRIKSVASLLKLDEKIKEDFLVTAYNQSDNERQYLLWLEGYTQEKDLSNIAKQIRKESITSYYNPFKKIFEKLTDPAEQEKVLIEFLEIIASIDSEEKYSRVKYLSELSALEAKVKNRLIDLAENNVYHQTKQFLNYSQFIEGDKHQKIIDLFNRLDITYFYSFCIDLLNPLAKINTQNYCNGYSYLKIYLEKKEFINETNKNQGNSSIFNYKGVLLNENHFETKIAYFRIISFYIENNLKKIEDAVKLIIKTSDFDLISRLLKNFHSYNSINFQICSDLKTNVPTKPNIESFVVDLCDTEKLLRLWVYGLIEYFNFKTYCYYYFTLSIEERKIFNKKAKAKMGEEMKVSMLKKREPWQFVEKATVEDNLEIYTASWKSIWFGDGFIRVCMDSKPSFSEQFKWEFSEDNFNFLYEYISGKRLNDLKITATGNIIKNLQGLDELEEIIWKILIVQEVQSTDRTTIRGTRLNRIPINMLLRNQCIQLLNKFQLKELVPTRVLEIKNYPIKGKMGVDVSLLYSIPINENEVAIIWESLELEKAKATHIFKCQRMEYEIIFSEIANFLSGTLNVRSTLNSKDADAKEQQDKLRYRCKIEHDNFNFSKWEKSLYEILPELKLFVLKDE